MTDDPTLDEMRPILAPLIAQNAAFDGWTPAALAAAATQAGIDPAHAALAFPAGAIDMIDAWFATIDAAIRLTLTSERLANMKIRERITALITGRLELLAQDREALRRALAILAMPQNLVAGASLGWRAADAMWRLAGDTAVDLNHYSKRATLAGVYGATLLAFLSDESEELGETRAFLARRIEDIMRFERLKARFRSDPVRRPSLTRFLGRLRYPVA